MTSRDFCYWLQGLFELGAPASLDEKQTESVKKHLAMVFLHEIDPSAGTPEHQAELSALHSGLKELQKKLEDQKQHPGPGAGMEHMVLRC